MWSYCFREEFLIMLSSKDFTVVIPARAGSTRVPNKNFKEFAGTSLMEIKIHQAIDLGFKTIINSDSDIAENLANKFNLQFHRRPDYFASNQCSNSEYYEYLAKNVSSEIIVILQPTAPLLLTSTIQNCINTYIKNYENFDSLVTSDFVKKFAFYDGRPINYDLNNMPNSQDLVPIVMPTYNVMITKVSSLLKFRNVITDKCMFFEISQRESFEIDTPEEFEVAEILYKGRNT